MDIEAARIVTTGVPVVTMRVGADAYTRKDDRGGQIVGANGDTIAVAGREPNSMKRHLVI